MAPTTTTQVPDIHTQLEKIINPDGISTGGNENTSDSDVEKPVDLENKLRVLPTRPRKQESFDSVSSNGDEEDDDNIQLTDELREKIIVQAEYYFSDENLSRDGFLLKHVKRNKEGFVNLKLLASFKKVRLLSNDYRVIGEALKTSTKLIVNETGLKIRRVNPLPQELLDQARVKILVVSRMPEENPSMDYVIAAFPGHKDDVISVRVVKPGKKFPNELQSHFSRNPELKDQIVAIVEFDTPENAAAAFKEVDKGGKYVDMDVKLLELGPKQAKRMSNSSNPSSNNKAAPSSTSPSNNTSPSSTLSSTGPSSTTSSSNNTSSESANSDSPSASDSSGAGRKAKKKTGKEGNGKKERPVSCTSSSDSDWSSFSSCSKRYSRSHGNNQPNNQSPSPPTKSKFSNDALDTSPRKKSQVSSASSGSESPKSPEKRMKDGNTQQATRKVSPLAGLESSRCIPEENGKSEKNDDDSSGSGELCPWMYQRMQLSNDAGAVAQKHLEIIRQPRGPNGSTGFANHPLRKYVLVHA